MKEFTTSNFYHNQNVIVKYISNINTCLYNTNV